MPDKRLVSFHMVMADEERDAVRAGATADGVSMARWLIEKALTGSPPRDRIRMREELLTVRRTLVRMGANVNQATIATHVTGDAGQLVRMAAQLEAALQRHDAALRRLR